MRRITFLAVLAVIFGISTPSIAAPIISVQYGKSGDFFELRAIESVYSKSIDRELPFFVRVRSRIYSEVNLSISTISPEIKFPNISIDGQGESLGFHTFYGLKYPPPGLNLPVPFAYYSQVLSSFAVPYPFLEPGSYVLHIRDSEEAGIVQSYRAQISLIDVPEPQAWSMMILGFCFIGLTMRRDQSKRKPARMLNERDGCSNIKSC